MKRQTHQDRHNRQKPRNNNHKPQRAQTYSGDDAPTKPDENASKLYSLLCNDFQKYFFTQQLISNITATRKRNSETTDNRKQKTKQKLQNRAIKYCPSGLDTLFWCYYILKNNMLQYEQLNISLSFVIEKKHKIELVEYIRQNKTSLKGYKLVSLDHIENQLANEIKIDLATFFSLCYMDKLQVFYFNDKCYTSIFPLEEDQLTAYETYCNIQQLYPPEKPTVNKDPEDSDYEEDDTTDETYFRNCSIFEQHNVKDESHIGMGVEMYKNESLQSTFMMLKQSETSGAYYLQQFKYSELPFTKYYRIDNISKPLRAISAYTLIQLKELSQIFNIPHEKVKKQELYDQLKQRITLNICHI